MADAASGAPEGVPQNSAASLCTSGPAASSSLVTANVVRCGLYLATAVGAAVVCHRAFRAYNQQRAPLSRPAARQLLCVNFSPGDVGLAQKVLGSWGADLELVPLPHVLYTESTDRFERLKEDVCGAHGEQQSAGTEPAPVVCLGAQCVSTIAGEEPDLLQTPQQRCKACRGLPMSINCTLVLTLDGSVCRYFEEGFAGTVASTPLFPVAGGKLVARSQPEKAAGIGNPVFLPLPETFFTGTTKKFVRLPKEFSQADVEKMLRSASTDAKGETNSLSVLLTPLWGAYLQLGFAVLYGTQRSLAAQTSRWSAFWGHSLSSDETRRRDNLRGTFVFVISVALFPDPSSDAHKVHRGPSRLTSLAEALQFRVLEPIDHPAPSDAARSSGSGRSRIVELVFPEAEGDLFDLLNALWQQGRVIMLLGFRVRRLKLMLKLPPSITTELPPSFCVAEETAREAGAEKSFSGFCPVTDDDAREVSTPLQYFSLHVSLSCGEDSATDGRSADALRIDNPSLDGMHLKIHGEWPRNHGEAQDWESARLGKRQIQLNLDGGIGYTTALKKWDRIASALPTQVESCGYFVVFETDL